MLLQMWPLISVVGRYYKLDTLLLKEKKLPILDVTGFFFRIRTRVMAMVLCRFTTPPPFPKKNIEVSEFFLEGEYIPLYLLFMFEIRISCTLYHIKL